MRWRIRSQLLLPVVLLLVGVAGISVGTALSAARQATRQVEHRLRTVAQAITARPTIPLTDYVLQLLGPLSGMDYVFVLDAGEARKSSDRLPDRLPPGVPVADDPLSLTLGLPVRFRESSYLCSGFRVRRPDESGVLYVLYPESLWRDARWEAIWPSLLLGVTVGSVALALAVWQSARLIQRIGDLERRTRAIASGDFSPMPMPAGDDEIRELAGSINDMAGQLSRLQDAVRRTERLRLLGQVSGGLAHQLRNGLTGARLAIQLHRQEAGGDTTALDVALRQLTLLETHVKRLLDLGKARATDRRPADLAALVGEAVELLLPRCRHAGIELRWAAPSGPVVASVDEGQWGQVLVNLLTNAIDAAGPGGTVEVGIRRDEGGIVLEVSDSGPGPDEATAGRLFEPFVTSKPEGVGLGLAVARQVVEAHGGRIGWERRDGLTCFRVELPEGKGGKMGS